MSNATTMVRRCLYTRCKQIRLVIAFSLNIEGMTPHPETVAENPEDLLDVRAVNRQAEVAEFWLALSSFSSRNSYSTLQQQSICDGGHAMKVSGSHTQLGALKSDFETLRAQRQQATPKT
jgi:hypothetical protein